MLAILEAFTAGRRKRHKICRETKATLMEKLDASSGAPVTHDSLWLSFLVRSVDFLLTTFPNPIILASYSTGARFNQTRTIDITSADL